MMAMRIMGRRDCSYDFRSEAKLFKGCALCGRRPDREWPFAAPTRIGRNQSRPSAFKGNRSPRSQSLDFAFESTLISGRLRAASRGNGVRQISRRVDPAVRPARAEIHAPRDRHSVE